jgi:hypothetical protein
MEIAEMVKRSKEGKAKKAAQRAEAIEAKKKSLEVKEQRFKELQAKPWDEWTLDDLDERLRAGFLLKLLNLRFQK